MIYPGQKRMGQSAEKKDVLTVLTKTCSWISLLEVAQNYTEYECLVNMTFKSNAVIQ